MTLGAEAGFYARAAIQMTDSQIPTRRLFLRSAACSLVSMCGVGGAAGQLNADEITLDEHREIKEKADAFRNDFKIPGLSLAIARSGRLVYAQGFGIADEGAPVQPSHLFRIASVSKPITSVAVFSLIEQNRIRLTDQVFGPGGILGSEHERSRRERPIGDITIEHLLTHTAGGWSNAQSDPMFANPQMNHFQLIEWTLNNVPLTDAPGSKHAYSNFGYCILGRVIEKVTGQSYANYVRSAVLRRCGVTNMQIAGNTRFERARGEVSYYPDGNPYNINVRRMDSHGGWIASAPDLVRLATHVDGFSSERSILRLETIKTMTAPSRVNSGYAMGWSVNGRNWWHTGSLPGTSSIIVRTQSGFCWAALANARHDNSVVALDRLVWSIVRTVKQWQA
jgi:CubicO group peptidase (beta-lactamase class C family)